MPRVPIAGHAGFVFITDGYTNGNIYYKILVKTTDFVFFLLCWLICGWDTAKGLAPFFTPRRVWV